MRDEFWCQREEIEVLFGIQNTKSRCVCCFKLDEKPQGRAWVFLLVLWSWPLAGWNFVTYCGMKKVPPCSLCCLVDSVGDYFHFNLLFPLVAAQGVRGPAPAVICLGPRRLARRLLPHIWWLIKLQCKFAFSLSILTTSCKKGWPMQFQAWNCF